MTDRLGYANGRVSVGLPIDPSAFAELRRQIPRASRVFDPRNRTLLVDEAYGLLTVDILARFAAETIGGAR